MIEKAKKITILSERKARKKHPVSYDTIIGMENDFIKEGCSIRCLSATIYKANRVLNKLKLHRFVDYIPDEGTDYYLYIAMVIDDLYKQEETLRKVAKNKDLILYCFDTWEKNYTEWEKVFNRIKPRAIFLAYKESVEFFSAKLENVFFLPQSMNTEFFHPYDVEKTRLFMQMGRKNTKLHQFCLSYLARHNMDDSDQQYVYERIPGKIIFPKTEQLAENISRSKFFICAPRFYENTDLTGKVSDVTARYYEAMACKSLIVGFKPGTYNELFPVDSMVEIKSDGSNFEEQISYWLIHEDEYKEQIERNYRFVMDNHTWKNRLKSMIAALEKIK